MAFLLRPLYAKVAFLRPDLEETARIGFAVQEAMREVCRRTFLARDNLSAVVDIGQDVILPIPVADRNLLLVHGAAFHPAGSTDGIPLTPCAFPDLEGRKGRGEPRWFAQQGSRLRLFPSPDGGGLLACEYSFVPVSETEEAPLPEVAAAAVEARAESMLLRLPGKEGFQNLAHAKERERDFRRCIGNLKAISFHGESGEIRAETAPFPGAP